MGLKLLESSTHYQTEKPDLVAIYLDKRKYYVVEIVCEECVSINSPRLSAEGLLENHREYCKKLFPNNNISAALLATVICDLISGVEAFSFKTLQGYKFNDMTMYAAVAIPTRYLADLQHVLDFLQVEHGSLDILDKFTLVLISKEDSEKLIEKRKFIKFLIDNK